MVIPVGAYVNSRRWVSDENSPTKMAEVIDFFLEDTLLVESLPGNGEIKESSTAFVPSTGEIFVLMGEGWVLMP